MITLIDPKGVMKGLNTGLAYLAASLKKNNYSAQVIDFNNLPYSKQRLKKSFESDVICISVKSSTEKSIKSITRIIKKNSNALIVCGGAHLSIDAENFMNDNREVDICIVGEGEKILLDILKGKKLDKIKGIIYRSKNKIKINPGYNSIKNLDSLPFPDYSVFDSVQKYGISINWDAKYPLLTSKGCPYDCIFCLAPILSKNYRTRTPKKIMEELLHAKKEYNINSFSIIDDNFTQDIERAKKFCNLLISKKLNLTWDCPMGVRADKLDKELITLMKKSGCVSVSLGIETAEESVFRLLNKNEQLSDIVRAIKLLKDAKIEVIGFFILGLPHSTFEKDMKSVNFAIKHKLDRAYFNHLYPLPKTSLMTILKNSKKIRFLHDWKKGLIVGNEICIVETKDYPRKERIKAYYFANLRLNNYYIFVLNCKNSFEKILKLLTIIVKYDPFRFPRHVYYLVKIIIRNYFN